MNTPESLAAVFDAVTEYNRSGDVALAQVARAALETLGFTFEERSVGDALTPQLLDLLVTVRNDARERRDWKGADQIRNQLKEIGVVLEDTPEGTRWKIER
jgi:cysteinyl-tRNA synthetase